MTTTSTTTTTTTTSTLTSTSTTTPTTSSTTSSPTTSTSTSTTTSITTTSISTSTSTTTSTSASTSTTTTTSIFTGTTTSTSPTTNSDLIVTTLALQLHSKPSETTQDAYIPATIAAVVIVVVMIVGGGIGIYWCHRKTQKDKLERQIAEQDNVIATLRSAVAAPMMNPNLSANEAMKIWQANGLMLNAENITLGEKIGYGGAGQVYHGKWGSVDVALKESYSLSRSGKARGIIKEVTTLAKLNNPRIVSLFGMWYDNSYSRNPKLYMVMEYCALGSVADHIGKDYNQVAPPQPTPALLGQRSATSKSPPARPSSPKATATPEGAASASRSTHANMPDLGQLLAKTVHVVEGLAKKQDSISKQMDKFMVEGISKIQDMVVKQFEAMASDAAQRQNAFEAELRKSMQAMESRLVTKVKEEIERRTSATVTAVNAVRIDQQSQKVLLETTKKEVSEATKKIKRRASQRATSSHSDVSMPSRKQESLIKDLSEGLKDLTEGQRGGEDAIAKVQSQMGNMTSTLSKNSTLVESAIEEITKWRAETHDEMKKHNAESTNMMKTLDRKISLTERNCDKSVKAMDSIQKALEKDNPPRFAVDSSTTTDSSSGATLPTQPYSDVDSPDKVNTGQPTSASACATQPGGLPQLETLPRVQNLPNNWRGKAEESESAGKNAEGEDNDKLPPSQPPASDTQQQSAGGSGSGSGSGSSGTQHSLGSLSLSNISQNSEQSEFSEMGKDRDRDESEEHKTAEISTSLNLSNQSQASDPRSSGSGGSGSGSGGADGDDERESSDARTSGASGTSGSAEAIDEDDGDGDDDGGGGDGDGGDGGAADGDDGGDDDNDDGGCDGGGGDDGDGNKHEDEVKGVTGEGDGSGDGDGSGGGDEVDTSKAAIDKAWKDGKSYKPTTRESVELLQTTKEAFGVDDGKDGDAGGDAGGVAGDGDVGGDAGDGDVGGDAGDGDGDGDGSGGGDEVAGDTSKAAIDKAWKDGKSYKPMTRESVELLQTTKEAFGVDDGSEEEKKEEEKEGDEDKNAEGGDNESKETAESGHAEDEAPPLPPIKRRSNRVAAEQRKRTRTTRSNRSAETSSPQEPTKRSREQTPSSASTSTKKRARTTKATKSTSKKTTTRSSTKKAKTITRTRTRAQKKKTEAAASASATITTRRTTRRKDKPEPAIATCNEDPPKWECQLCTFRNHGSLAQCEMCSSAKPAEQETRRSTRRSTRRTRK